MKDWCMEHPYLTLIIVVLCLLTINSIVTQLIGLFKKSEKTATINLALGPELKNQQAISPNGDPLN